MRKSFVISVVISIFITLTLCSCVSLQMQKLKQKLDQQIGHNIDEVIAKFGVPTNTYTLSNGNKIYEFSFSQTQSYNYADPMVTMQQGQITTQWVPYSGINTVWCKLIFTTDSNGYIIAWRTIGNGCY
jgi:hypothetical protein